LTRKRVESGSSILRPLKYLENCEYFCYLKDVLQARIQVGKFYPSANLRSRAIQTYQDAEAAAIDVPDFAEIEHHLLGFGQVIPDEMPQISRLFAKHKPTATLNNKDPSKRARDHLKRHDKPSSSVRRRKNSGLRNLASNPTYEIVSLRQSATPRG
jgi:hypothetical protein